MRSTGLISNFTKSAGFKKYFANTSWILFNKIFTLAVAFFVGIYVARYLGPENYGILNYAKSIAVFFVTVAKLGLESNILTRNVLESPEESNKIIGTAFVVRIVISLFITIGALMFMPFYDDQLTYAIILIIVSTSIFNSFNVIKLYFESKVKAKFVSMSVFISTVIASIYKLVLIYFSASLIYFGIAYLVEAIVLAIGLIVMYNIKAGSLFAWKFNRSYIKELLNDAWPLLFSGFVVLIYMKTDQIMIKFLIDEKAVGYYAAAVRLSEVWIFVGTMICASLFPAIVNAKNKSSKLYNNRMQQLYDLMVYLAVAIALPISILSHFIINLTFGSNYIESASVLSIHVWTMVFVYLGAASSKWLIAENLQKITLYRTTLGAIVNVILNLVLIPKFGIQGAAFATLVSQMFASYLGYLISKNTYLAFIMQTKALFFISSISLLKKEFKNFSLRKV